MASSENTTFQGMGNPHQLPREPFNSSKTFKNIKTVKIQFQALEELAEKQPQLDEDGKLNNLSSTRNNFVYNGFLDGIHNNIKDDKFNLCTSCWKTVGKFFWLLQ